MNSNRLTFLDGIILTALAIASFFILTQGIPLIQIGWLGELSKKSKYMNVLRLSVALFVVLMFLIKGFFPDHLKETWIAKKISSFSLGQLIASGIVLYALYASLYIFVGFVRYAAFNTRAFDLGIFAQAVWTTLHGEFLFSSLKENTCLMGDHVSPILLVTVPFYALWQDPRILLILQALAAGSFILPLLYFTYKKTRDPWITFIFLLVFCFYMPTRSSLHEDFHPEILVEPLIFLAFLALEEGWWKRFSVLALFIIAGKENMCGITFILGFYAFLFKNKKAFGLFWMILSVVIFILETRFLVPMLNTQGYFYAANFERLATSGGLTQRLFNLSTLQYVVEVFVPFLFLPFLHIPTLTLTFPILFQNILSSNPLMKSLTYHYLTGMTAFIFISAVSGFDLLMKRYTWFSKHARMWAGILLAVSLMRSGPSEYYKIWNIKKNQSSYSQLLRSHLKDLPQSYRVLTHNNLIPQISNRMFIYQFDYNEAISKFEQAQKLQVDCVILDRGFWEGRKPYEESLIDFQVNGFRPQVQTNDFVILIRRDALELK